MRFAMKRTRKEGRCKEKEGRIVEEKKSRRGQLPGG
jgi:hypothetical protein